MGEMPVATVWTSLAKERLHFRMWDDDDFSIVYNAGNGDTHRLDPLTFEVLRLLQAAPSSSDGLVQACQALIVAQDHDRTAQFVEASLLKLQDIGLVHRAPP
jgi:PqqD family protein of HPr-rel-A system